MQMLLKVKMTPCFIIHTGYSTEYRPSRDRETGQARPGQDRTEEESDMNRQLPLSLPGSAYSTEFQTREYNIDTPLSTNTNTNTNYP